MKIKMYIVFIYVLVIINRVTHGNSPLYRPQLPPAKDEKQVEISRLMEACWQENPTERPSFYKIKQILKRLSKGM